MPAQLHSYTISGTTPGNVFDSEKADAPGLDSETWEIFMFTPVPSEEQANGCKPSAIHAQHEWEN
jgi:hypothetical protein